MRIILRSLIGILNFHVPVLFILLFSFAASANERTVIFSATYCPMCLSAKQFFKEHDIPYTEFDIETDAEALAVFRQLGGRGTPLVFVDNRRLKVFSEKRFMDLYRSPPGKH